MSKFFRVCAIVTTFSLSAAAQFYPSNARIDAMGGTFIIKDRSEVFRYAARMADYKNDIQVGFKGSNGTILGIKSLGEMLDLGVMGNRGLVGDPGFYTSAMNAVNSSADYQDLDITKDYIPHVLFGFGTDAFLFGLDGFFELSHASYHHDADGAITDDKSTIMNPGLIASVVINHGQSIPISLKAGFGVPKLKASHKAPGADEVTVSNDKGLMLDFGGEVGLPIGSLDGTLGADLILNDYKFKGNPTKYLDWQTAYYFGLSKKIFDDGVIGFMYEMQWLDATNSTESPDVKNKNGSLHQIASIGAENNWSKVWFLDKASARGGIRYEYVKGIAKVSAGNDNATARGFADGGFSPTVGLGATKGAFTLDLYIDLGAWANLVNGPAVGSITGTLDF